MANIYVAVGTGFGIPGAAPQGQGVGFEVATVQRSEPIRVSRSITSANDQILVTSRFEAGAATIRSNGARPFRGTGTINDQFKELEAGTAQRV